MRRHNKTKQNNKSRKKKQNVCRGRVEKENITGVPVPRHDRVLGNVAMCGLAHLLCKGNKTSCWDWVRGQTSAPASCCHWAFFPWALGAQVQQDTEQSTWKSHGLPSLELCTVSVPSRLLGEGHLLAHQLAGCSQAAIGKACLAIQGILCGHPEEGAVKCQTCLLLMWMTANEPRSPGNNLVSSRAGSARWLLCPWKGPVWLHFTIQCALLQKTMCCLFCLLLECSCGGGGGERLEVKQSFWKPEIRW